MISQSWTQLLESNFSVVLGAVLLLVLLAVRAGTGDKQLRRDLRGAVGLMFAFLVLRLVDWSLEGRVLSGMSQAFGVGWRLALAFGVIRATVAAGLWTLRLRSPVATPKILRDVIDGSLYLLAAVAVLKSQLDIDLTGLLATSAILSVVFGLALQDTLGNLFAGLSIQLERPFQVGDFVTVGPHTGQVTQIAWRATRIETGRREVITVPNSVVSKESVKNYSRGAQPVGFDLQLGLSYSTPPNRAKAVLLDVLKEMPHVLADPPPRVRPDAFSDSSITYQLRYFVPEFLYGDQVKDELLSTLWYRLRREGIEIPFPHQVALFRTESASEDASAGVRTLVDSVDLFSGLSEEERALLAREAMPRKFGRGEQVIEAGEEGHTFYVVAEGQVAVLRHRGGPEVTRMGRGGYFGEMSLLTGEARAATVVAVEDALLLEVGRPIFARLFAENPALARELSAVLAQRSKQLRAAASADAHPRDVAPEANRILARLRHIFRLTE